jgi:Tfp pilus assembly protein PilZ
MQAKPEFKRSERIGHESIIKIEDGQTLSPYYVLSQNLSETGMHFKSLFELYPGAHILIRIDDYTLSGKQVPAKVVWCKKLENTTSFRYGVGVEFLQLQKNFGLKASLPIITQIKTPKRDKGGVVIKMEKRSGNP